MASKFQNRLVGTFVLVALSVVVLPIIFDGDKKYNESKFASIPLVSKSDNGEDIRSIPPLTQSAPPVPPVNAVEAMQLQEQKADTDVLSEPTVKPEVPPQRKVETKSKSVEQAPQATAYVVQLGALKNAGKVDEILAKLRLLGHQVYTVPSSPVQGQLTRIYVGPNASRQKLESVLSELRQITGLQGQIKNYKP
ncbi:cell division protein DedD [Xenorhabdus anantnagensis]|uniref:Cell division protein DedD n=1 Tax=Xenorhabdus anantnagensis TaxID=3025875 RepID=A0ABT5LQA5_9GAMM|nr:cell division protein DedD [Xenorhabdus anantnagensis]MDC9596593.1 cell division protein DedD [Xenorhabdus anantnagensis]